MIDNTTFNLKQGLQEAIKYIKQIKKQNLDKFLLGILDSKTKTIISTDLFVVQEFNNFLIQKQLIQKEHQINFCFFFSYLIQSLDFSKACMSIINEEIILKGNSEKTSYITNILDNWNKDKKYKVDIKNLFEGKNPIIQTSYLNKKKFNTINFLTYLLINYKYELRLTKTTVKHLLYIFYILRTRTKDKNQETLDKEIQDYIFYVIKFLETYYDNK